jgi:hypothetical protein
MGTIARALPIFPLTLTVSFLVAQTAEAPPGIKPRFALSVALPAAIKPKSELLLETEYKNISDQDLYNAAEFQQREIDSINLRDAKGVPVPKLLKAQDRVSAVAVTASVAIPLAPAFCESLSPPQIKGCPISRAFARCGRREP